ncbi:capsular polysaccharide export protein, LipB/KpsS family [Achromobacter insolitus]|uniref:capsular polysaccharide export protein, LipB/KpsS family n=1 Tax=Achromobacter insolitus TaxID=217204 RepID=UPI0027DF1E7E|nr:hypothetical protein [Achromobacter insolitus]MDQ6212209.1 hypothetical protein [Achromobacter insolitus]
MDLEKESAEKSISGRIFSFRKSVNFGAEVIRSVTAPVTVWRRTAWVFNVAKWKRPLLRRYLSNYNLRFLALKDDVYQKERRIRMSLRPIFVIWGRTLPERLEEFAEEFDIPIHHVEDGFMRSIGLGASHVLPYSLCYDRTGLYYDASQPSDLETILATYDFQSDKTLMARASAALESIRELRLSKYNETRTDLAAVLYGPKVRRRILVVGQVEDDQSLLYGCRQIMKNAELIRLAATENPDAQIIYKPHPDVLAGLRKEISNTSECSQLAEILKVQLSLVDALEGVDRVYTMTSLAGFEALLNGVAVTTVGAPFYAGWGLTDDRQPEARRSRQLSIEEVFAAAYILYPVYRNPVTYAAMQLEEVIDEFKEQLSEVDFLTPEKSLKRLKPYNLMTGHSVDSRFLYNSTAKNIAIITDSPRAWYIARGMAGAGKNMSVMATRDTLANDESLLVNSEEQAGLKVTSIHKKYSVAMSKAEKSAVELTHTFSDSMRLALTEVAAEHLNSEVVEALSFGLEDYIYYESIRFYGIKECLDEFDAVLIYIDNADSSLDIIKSFIFHGKSKSMLGKVFLSLSDGTTKEFLAQVSSTIPPVVSAPQDISELKTNFSRFWWSLQKRSFDEYDSYGPHVAVCGNVGGLNYAYSPASLKIVDTVDRRSNLPILFYNSGLLPASGQEEVKLIALLADLSKRCAVYNGNLAKFRSKYPEEILESASFFSDRFFERVLELARQRLPEEFVDIFRPRISKYCESLFAQVIFVAEAGHAMDRAVVYATAMDRSHISRILAALARSRKVASIGIQPQIISTSTRYKPPAVDRMGVIDTSQVGVFSALGAKPDRLERIGSVNIDARLSSMDEAVKEYGREPTPGSILFAMQHSTSFEMLATARALKSICERNELTLIVKPHPHQELPILNEVRAIFGECAFARVLGRDSDTYDAVARSAIIVGLFSSVLLESALYGKDVVVAAFREIDESIDFSLSGLAVKVHDEAALEDVILQLKNGGEVARALQVSRNAYLQENPQLGQPFDGSSVEKFIAAHIPAV